MTEGRNGARQEVATLSIQPHPEHVQVAYLVDGGKVATAIARTWPDGASALCRLCPTCRADRGKCLVIVGEHVPGDSAPLYALPVAGVRGRKDGLPLP